MAGEEEEDEEEEDEDKDEDKEIEIHVRGLFSPCIHCFEVDVL